MMVRMCDNMSFMRKDFLIVKLQPKCWICRQYILTKERYFCPVCKVEDACYDLCPTCYEKEKIKPPLLRHPLKNSSGEPCQHAHELLPMELEDNKLVEYLSEKTYEPDDNIECDFFANRIQFLSLCQGNHYQFDQLRRAKHSTMMVLYHLHNPMAPAFVHSCNICNQEIQKVRFSCSVCKDFDMCIDCTKKNKGLCPLQHMLKRFDLLKDAMSALTADQRQQQAKQLKMQLQLIKHATTCKDLNCPSNNCAKMKRLLLHAKTCDAGTKSIDSMTVSNDKASDNSSSAPSSSGKDKAGEKAKATHGKGSDSGISCSQCKRLWPLLEAHATHCKLAKGQCKILRCEELKDRLRSRRLDQQRAEDR